MNNFVYKSGKYHVHMHWADSILWIDSGTSTSWILSDNELSTLTKVVGNYVNLPKWKETPNVVFEISHRDARSNSQSLFEMFFDEELHVGIYLQTKDKGLGNINLVIPEESIKDFDDFLRAELLERNKMNDSKITIPLTVSKKLLVDAAINGLESTMWLRVPDYHYEKVESALLGGESVNCYDAYEDDKHYELTLDKLTKGLGLMAQLQPQHFADYQKENFDAITSDVLLQFSLFGELLYG